MPISSKYNKNLMAIKKGIDSSNNEVNEDQLFACVKDKTKFTKGDFINYKSKLKNENSDFNSESQLEDIDKMNDFVKLNATSYNCF